MKKTEYSEGTYMDRAMNGVGVLYPQRQSYFVFQSEIKAFPCGFGKNLHPSGRIFPKSLCIS